MPSLLKIVIRLRTAFRVRLSRLTTIAIRQRLSRQMILLDQRGFSLIANNCVAGLLYEMASLPKRTPTIGLFFRNAAFPSFLKDLADGDLSAWTPINADALGVDKRSGFPALIQDRKLAIVFLHYHNPIIAAQKWNDRFARIVGRKIIVVASLRDGLISAMLTEIPACFQDVFVIGPAPAPPADEVLLNRGVLQRLSLFFDGVLARDC